MASGLASVALEPGDVVESLGRNELSDLTVLPITKDIDAFVQRAVNIEDRAFVERNRLIVHIKGRELREFFAPMKEP